ncbi:MAG: D-Ala-D-Ala carboxypeptidase family metallohydrolase [Bacillota bacterium]
MRILVEDLHVRLPEDQGKGYAGAATLGHPGEHGIHGALVYQGSLLSSKVAQGWPALRHTKARKDESLEIRPMWSLSPSRAALYRLLIQAGPLLVVKGRALRQHQGAISAHPQAIIPRVAVGVTDAEHVMVAARDSTIWGMACWMRDLGCVDAMAGPSGPAACFMVDGHKVYGDGSPTLGALAWTRHEILVSPGEALADPGLNYRLTQNFDAREFSCPHCSRVMLSKGFEDLVLRLQALRSDLGRPVIITSSYRCPEYNGTLPGAAKNSLHMKGMAADIRVPGMSIKELTRRAMPFFENGGIGVYQGHLHVDVGSKRRW